MLRIDLRTNKISLTRGDTAYLEINITDDIAAGLSKRYKGMGGKK